MAASAGGHVGSLVEQGEGHARIALQPQLDDQRGCRVQCAVTHQRRRDDFRGRRLPSSSPEPDGLRLAAGELPDWHFVLSERERTHRENSKDLRS